MVRNMALNLGADYAIVTEEGYGNPDTDYVRCQVILEDAGIPVVGVSNECTGRDGFSQPLVTLDEKLTALVSTGNVSELTRLPACKTVIGCLEAMNRDGMSGSWGYDEVLGKSARDDGSIIIMDDKDLTMFVNLLSEDYYISPVNGRRYEIKSKKLMSEPEGEPPRG